MPGYAARTIRLNFDLTEDPQNDPIWVVIKNPKLLPPQMFRNSGAAELEVDEATGQPKNADAAADTGAQMAGRLIVAWRVYDATTSPEFDPQTGEELPGTTQDLLPAPAGGNGVPPEQYAKLPGEIQIKIMETIAEAINPSKAQSTQNSSGQPNPPTTELGSPEPSLQS